MKTERLVLGGCVAFALAWGIAFVYSQQQPVSRPRPTVHLPGKAVDVKGDALKRFPQPVTVVPSVAPPQHREGHDWRWHPRVGWILLPSTIRPGTVLLPADYVLPETVTVFQTQADSQLVCPHCHQPITITISR